MGDGSEDVEDQLTGGGCGVDPLFEADKPDILILEVFDGFQQFLGSVADRGEILR